MAQSDLREVLSSRCYPGRGCVAARTTDGTLLLGYFLTGRSAASRARRLELLSSGDIEIKDTSDGAHDELRHYVASARRGRWTIVGNGDHVEPVATSLAAGTDPVTAWALHTYEPDPPIFTPRIWIGYREADDGVVVGSATRSNRSDGSADRLLLLPEALPAGEGILLTTYEGDVEQVLTSGTATSVRTSYASQSALLRDIWESLDSDLAVGAFVAPANDLKAATFIA